MYLKYLFLLFIIILNSCQTKFLYENPNEKKEILKLLESQQSAWNRGNLEEFMFGYWNSEELRFIGSRGITKGYNNTLANYKKGYPTTDDMGKLTFDIYEVKLLAKHTAHVVGRYTLIRQKDNPTGVFTLILQKINGEWKIVLDHTGS